MFNQPAGGERQLHEHDGYDVIKEWHDGAWRPVRWIYSIGANWVIGNAPPYWLNHHQGFDSCELRAAKDKEHAIECALGVGYRYLPHSISCPCKNCTAASDSVMTCPRCGAEHEDFDGLGVLYCGSCDYCVHASATGGVCDFCGKNTESEATQ